MEFTQWLAAEGYDAEALNKPEAAKQRKHLEAAFKAETAPPADPPREPVKPPEAAATPAGFEAAVALAQEKNRRVTFFRDLTAKTVAANAGNAEKCKQLEQLCEAAVAEVDAAAKVEDMKVDAKDFELAALRMERRVGPMVMTPKPAPADGDLDARVTDYAKRRNAQMTRQKQPA